MPILCVAWDGLLAPCAIINPVLTCSKYRTACIEMIAVNEAAVCLRQHVFVHTCGRRQYTEYFSPTKFHFVCYFNAVFV